MKGMQIWFYIIGAVAIAVLGNSVSTIWAKGDDKISWWLLAVLVISPMVFVSFGLVTSKIGLAIGSGVIDSLLTICTMTVGLAFFQEWNKISIFQFFGIFLALAGICMMVFFPKHPV